MWQMLASAVLNGLSFSVPDFDAAFKAGISRILLSHSEALTSAEQLGS